MPKLSFDLQMEGADKIMRFLQEASRENENMNKGAAQAISGMDESVRSVVKNLNVLSETLGKMGKADGSLKNVSQGIKDAFGETQANMLGRFSNQLQKLMDLQTQYDQRIESAQQRKSFMLKNNLTGPLYDNELGNLEAQLSGDLLRRSAVATQVDYSKMQGALHRMGWTGGANAIGQIAASGGLTNMLAAGGVGSLLRLGMTAIPSGLIAGGAIAGAAMSGLGAYASYDDRVFMSNQANMARSSNFADRMYAGRDPLAGGMIGQNMISGLGLSLDTEYVRGMQSGRFSRANLRTSINALTSETLFNGQFWGDVIGMGPLDALEAAKGRSIMNMRERYMGLDQAAYAGLNQSTAARFQFGLQNAPFERAFGIGGLTGAMRAYTGSGISLQEAQPFLSMQAQLGLGSSTSGIIAARNARELGTSAAYSSAFLMREATGRMTGDERFDQSWNMARSRAGLINPSDVAAGGILEDAIAQQRALGGFAGGGSASGYGSRLEAAVRATGGLQGVDPFTRTQLSVQTGQGILQNLQSPGTGTNAVALQTLTSFGLSAMEAQKYIEMGLDNDSTLDLLNSRLGGRFKDKNELRRALNAPMKGLQNQLGAIYKQAMGGTIDAVMQQARANGYTGSEASLAIAVGEGGSSDINNIMTRAQAMDAGVLAPRPEGAGFVAAQDTTAGAKGKATAAVESGQAQLVSAAKSMDNLEKTLRNNIQLELEKLNMNLKQINEAQAKDGTNALLGPGKK